MFSGWSPWVWVLAAWAEVALVYLGYLWYLNWRARRGDRNEDR